MHGYIHSMLTELPPDKDGGATTPANVLITKIMNKTRILLRRPDD